MNYPGQGERVPSLAAYTINEVLNLTKLGRTKLYQEINAGRLTARRCGKRTLVLASDLQAFLNGLEVVR